MDHKFLFDRHIFDAPPKEEIPEDLPPPPPTFSEEELAAAKEIAFEQGRQQGRKDEKESREQEVALLLGRIADHFSHLFAAESLRENIFEKESLRLSITALDVLFPTLSNHIGRDDVLDVLQKTLTDHRKTKEILIKVPIGMKADVEPLIARIRENENDPVLWRVLELADLPAGACSLEWGDGGAVRDPYLTALTIRKKMEALLGEDMPPAPLPDGSISEKVKSDVRSKDKSESGQAAAPAPPSAMENEHE